MSAIEMGFYIWNESKQKWLGNDEKSWTPSLFSAIEFDDPEYAKDIRSNVQQEDICYILRVRFG